MAKRRRDNTYFLDLMRMVGVSRWASMRALNLYPTSLRYRQKLVREMVDEGYAVIKPMEHSRRLRLTERGAERVFRSNPSRYDTVPARMIREGEYTRECMKRFSLRGEAYYLSEFAGYACHRDDKPAAETLLIPNKAKDGKQKLPGNRATYRYNDEAMRREEHPELDIATYTRRVTPIGCFYTLSELKALAFREVTEAGGTAQDLDNLKSARLTGLLFTSEGGWRVYSTETSALTIRMAGEAAMEVRLRDWCGNVYGTSLQRNENYSASFLRGTLLLGDAGHAGAAAVLRRTDPLLLGGDPYRGALERKKRDLPRDIMNVNNLGHLYFLPVLREALPLYGCMLFGRWEEALRRNGRDISLVRGEVRPVNRGIYDGELPDGRMFACIVPLNLSRVYQIVKDIGHGSKGVHFQCMEWQMPFIEKLKTGMDIKLADTITCEHPSQAFLELAHHSLVEQYG